MASIDITNTVELKDILKELSGLQLLLVYTAVQSVMNDSNSARKLSSIFNTLSEDQKETVRVVIRKLIVDNKRLANTFKNLEAQ